MEFIFENKYSNISLTVNIIEKGIHDNKHYVISNFWDYLIIDYLTGYCSYDNKIFEIALGKFEVKISFSTEMINNGDKLSKFIGNGWPSFHDSTFIILEYSSKKTVLRFYDVLPHQYVLDLTIKNIIYEDYEEKKLEFFTKGTIKSLKFSKKEDYMQIKMFHYYLFENEGNIKEFENYGVIKCKSLEVNFQKI